MSFEFSNFQNSLLPQNQNNGVFARFYDKYVKTGEVQSNGLPKFEKKLYVEIKMRDQHDVFDQPATEEHEKRFERAYQLYLQGRQQMKDGTPLEMFSFLSLEQIECCHLRGIFNVEKLSALDAKTAKNLDLQVEKELAVKFLKISKNNQAIFEIQNEKNECLRKIENLEKEIERLKKYEQKST